MRITDWPKDDRPREKILSKGEQQLTDAELLAIIIKTGSPGKTALDLGKELLQEHGSLKKLLRAPAQTLIKKTGMGQAKYASLLASIELGRRYLNEQLPTAGTILNSSRTTQQFLVHHLREHTNEVFACLFMDNHFRLICFEKLFFGTINEANVYPREILRRSLSHNAAKIILAHNHPSGNAKPSMADKDVTQRIQQVLELIDVNVVDHVIIGNPDNFSFAETGIL